ASAGSTGDTQISPASFSSGSSALGFLILRTLHQAPRMAPVLGVPFRVLNRADARSILLCSPLAAPHRRNKARILRMSAMDRLVMKVGGKRGNARLILFRTAATISRGPVIEPTIFHAPRPYRRRSSALVSSGSGTRPPVRSHG